MILKIEKKSYELELKTRNIAKVLDELGIRDITEAIFRGMADNDPKVLAVFIQKTATPMPSLNEVYDFIDDYRAENETTLSALYEMVINGLNNGYFFSRVMDEAQMESALKSPESMCMGTVMNNAVAKVVEDMAKDRLVE